MAEEPMTLIERLRNPAWNGGWTVDRCGVLQVGSTRADMSDAADRIERLETAINRYLAGDTHCNGGAQIMFEEAIGHDETANTR